MNIADEKDSEKTSLLHNKNEETKDDKLLKKCDFTVEINDEKAVIKRDIYPYGLPSVRELLRF